MRGCQRFSWACQSRSLGLKIFIVDNHEIFFHARVMASLPMASLLKIRGKRREGDHSCQRLSFLEELC